jgi:hypothetical protein
VLRRLGQIGDADGAGKFGLNSIRRPHELDRAIEHVACAHRLQVVGSQGIERRDQLAHDTSPQFDQVFEVKPMTAGRASQIPR